MVHPNHEKVIATTWAITFREIERRNTDAANLLRLWAFLDNKQLGHGLLIAARRGPADQWPGWLIRMAGDHSRFLSAMKLLRRYSMVEDEGGVEGTYFMHTVIHRWMLLLLNDEQRAVFSRLALLLIGNLVPTKIAPRHWALQRKLLPHAERWVERRREVSPSAPCTDGQFSMMSLHMLGDLFSGQGKLETAEEVYKRALEEMEVRLGRSYRSTLETASSLAVNYTRQGKFKEAEEAYKRTLRTREQAFGRDDVSTIETVHSLGSLYLTQERLDEAEEMYVWALRGTQTILGHNHESTLGIVQNLGVIYRKQHKFAEAQKMHARALKGYEAVLGRDHESTLTAVSNLGDLYAAQGKFKEARGLYERALRGFQMVQSAGHPRFHR